VGTEDERVEESDAQRKLREAAAELLAIPDLESSTPERFESELQQRLTAIEHEANELLAEYADDEGEARRCPLLHTSALATVIQQARVEAMPEFGCAFAELARVYPVERQGDVQDFSTLVPPVVPFALAVRLDERLALRVGISQARKVSPGTTWDDLKPWRAKVKPETREKRLRAWLADAEEAPVEAPLAVVEAWLSEAREHGAEEAAVAAGLGAFGRHNLVIHPELGTRVIFSAVLTDLDLSSDEAVTEDFCVHCDACVAACPGDALAEEGHTDVMRCIRNSQPYGIGGAIRFWAEYGAASPDERKALLRDPRYWRLYQAGFIGFQYFCFRCLAACPVGRS